MLADEIKALRAGNNPSPNILKQSPQSSTLIIKSSRLLNNSNAGQDPSPKTPTTTNNNIGVNVSPQATNSTAPIPSTVQHPQSTICKNIAPLVLSDSSESSDSENENTAKPSPKTKKKSKSVNVPNLIKAAPKPVKDPAPIKAAIKPKKLVDMFVGNIDKSVTATDMLSHIKSFEIPIEGSAITGVPQRSGNKAFKVSIDESYVTTLEKIWPDDIIVSVFKAKKKNTTKKQPFHKKSQQRNHPHNKWGVQRSNDRAWPGVQRSNDRAWPGMQNFQFPQRPEFGQYGFPYYYPY